jgi:hypothetical protein
MSEFPKGVMLYNLHANKDGSYLTIPSGVDFVVAVALSDMKAELYFNKHVQEAYNANIPCLAQIKINPKVYSDMFGLEDAVFPKADNDPYIKILDPLFLTPSRTSMYAIHGIILDIRVGDDNNTGNWIVAAAENVKNLCKERYFGIPIFILTDDKILKLYPNSNENPQVFLSTFKKLCTYSFSVTNNPDNNLIPNPINSPIPNWNNINFWWFGAKKFDFLSNTEYSYAPVLQYCKTKTELYQVLNFTPKPTPSDPSSGEEPDSPSGEETNDDFDIINNKLDSIETKIDEILLTLKKHFV